MITQLSDSYKLHSCELLTCPSHNKASIQPISSLIILIIGSGLFEIRHDPGRSTVDELPQNVIAVYFRKADSLASLTYK